MLEVPLTPANYRRRMTKDLANKLQHAGSSAPLLFDGLHRVSDVAWRTGTFWLGAAELATAVSVLVAFALSVRTIRRATPAEAPGAAHGHHGPDWLDVFLGVMLAVEVLVHHDETGRWKGPTMLLAAVTLMLGIFHCRLAARKIRRRSLKVTDSGIDAPGRFFFTGLRASWRDLAQIELTPVGALIVSRRGRKRRLTYRNLLRSEEVRAALEVAQAKLAEYKKTTIHAATDPSAHRDSSGGQQAETH